MRQPEAADMELALELLGRRVVFAHQPEGVAPALVTCVTPEAMVELEGWVGEFAPHLFVPAD